MLFGWEYFVAMPQLEKERARQALIHHEHPGAKPEAAPNAPAAVPAVASSVARADALKAGGARVAVDTPSLDGSLLLKGARFDDLRLKKYRETVNPKSPEIVLLAGAHEPIPITPCSAGSERPAKT